MRIGNIPILPSVIQQSSSSFLFKMILSRYKNRKPLCNLSALPEKRWSPAANIQLFFELHEKSSIHSCKNAIFSHYVWLSIAIKGKTYASEKQTNDVNRSKFSTGHTSITLTRNQKHHSSLQCLEKATSLSLSRYSCKNLNGKGYVISSSH